YFFFSGGFLSDGFFSDAATVILFLTSFAPQLFAILVAAPLAPPFFASPVIVATPPLTETLGFLSFKLAALANFSSMHFCMSASVVGVAFLVLSDLASDVFFFISCALALKASKAIKVILLNQTRVLFMCSLLKAESRLIGEQWHNHALPRKCKLVN